LKFEAPLSGGRARRFSNTSNERIANLSRRDL
jgi:hypothetical protein